MKKKVIAFMCRTGGGNVVENPQDVNPDMIRKFFNDYAPEAMFIISANMHEKLKNILSEERIFPVRHLLVEKQTMLWMALGSAELSPCKEIIFLGEHNFLQFIVDMVKVQRVHRFILSGKLGTDVELSKEDLRFKDNPADWKDDNCPYEDTPEDTYRGSIEISELQ